MNRFHFADGKESDMFYLIGLRIPDPFFYIQNETGSYAFLNGLEIGAFKEHHRASVQAVALEPLVAQARKIEGEAPVLHKLAHLLIKEYGLSHQEIAVSKHLQLDVADYLRTQGERLLIQERFVPERARKNAAEVEYMQSATHRTEEIFRLVESVLCDSVIKGDVLHYEGDTLTSERLTRMVLVEFATRDLEDTEGPIISCGPHAAMPHHHGAGPLRPHETIIVDLFPRDRRSGYYADMTRTYVKGRPSEQAQRMYDAVACAQAAAFALLRSGVPTKEVFEASAQAIREAGFDVGDRGFIHSLGHGLGLDVHEPIALSPLSHAVLLEGNVVTIEPGLYYPEFGGVRLEDVAVITKDGFRNLNTLENKLVIE